MNSLMNIRIDELLLMDSRSTLIHVCQHLEKRFGKMNMQLTLPCKKYANAAYLEDVDFTAARSRILSLVATMSMFWASQTEMLYPTS